MDYCNRCNRNISGIVLLDKPRGLSSNYLLQKVKKIFYANKAGYIGTLDPIATGMLPICFGEATKFSQYLLNSDKRYLVTARLGERTNTSDANGKIVAVRPVILNELRLTTALSILRKTLFQVPSMFSAIKYHGTPLYKYARKNIEIERKARPIQIYSLRLLYWDLTQIKLEIHCSKGTYIRTIIDDLGEYLNCGAHVYTLRRLAVAQYSTAHMVTFDKLLTIASNTKKSLTQLDTLLLPIDSAVKNLPIVNLSADIAAQIQHGKTVTIKKLLKVGLVRLTEGNNNRFFGIGEIIVPGQLIPKRLIAKI